MSARKKRLCSLLGRQAICSVTGNDSLVVGLATFDNNALGSAMTRQRLL